MTWLPGWTRLTLVAGIAALACGAGPDTAVSEPSGFRTEDYRSPTPATLEGAEVLSTEQAKALWQNGAATFIDVLPQPPKPAGLPPGTIWRPKPRFDIPGSIWLPDTGYGELAPVTEAYFRAGVEAATGHKPDGMLVFYCLKDCWHSWNAAKRALRLGYAHVAWYPDGTDGWDAAHLPLERREPVPRAGE